MNKKQKLGQEPAFATSADLGGEAIYQEGMSKRFYAACAAMHCVPPPKYNYTGTTESDESFDLWATKCYILADKLLEYENQ